MNAFKGVLNTLGIAVVSIIAIIVVYIMIVHLPVAYYTIRSPRAAQECSEIQVGMSTERAVEVLDKETPPLHLRFDVQDRELISSRRDGDCVVTFGDDNRVRSASSRPPEKTLLSE